MDIVSFDIKSFKQHLTQTGHNLKGLYLQLYKASSLPGKYVISLRFPSFLHAFLRNRPPQEHPPSVATVPLPSWGGKDQRLAGQRDSMVQLNLRECDI